jgi:hypothetical protein
MVTSGSFAILLSVGVIVCFVATSSIFFPQINNQASTINYLTNQVNVLTGALSSVIMQGNHNQTVLYGGVFQWSFYYAPAEPITVQPGQYNFSVVSTGGLSVFLLSLTPPPSPYTVPAGCTELVISIELFDPALQIPIDLIYLSQPNQNQIMLPCYNTGTCSFGQFNNTLAPPSKGASFFSTVVGDSMGSCAPAIGETFQLKGPWELVFYPN